MSAAGEDQKVGNQKQNWRDNITAELVINGLTLLVLTVTMAGVLWYACVATKQNDNLAASVAEQVAGMMPVVMADGVQPVVKGKKPDENQITHSPSDHVVVMVYNFGKTVAVDVAVPGILAIGRAEESAPTDPRCQPSGDPSPSIRKSPLAPLGESPQAGIASYYTSVWDFREGDSLGRLGEGDSLYAVGCIYYEGLDKRSYYTDICTIWRSGSFQTCSNPERNFICERRTCHK